MLASPPYSNLSIATDRPQTPCPGPASHRQKPWLATAFLDRWKCCVDSALEARAELVFSTCFSGSLKPSVAENSSGPHPGPCWARSSMVFPGFAENSSGIPRPIPRPIPRTIPRPIPRTFPRTIPRASSPPVTRPLSAPPSATLHVQYARAMYLVYVFFVHLSLFGFDLEPRT